MHIASQLVRWTIPGGLFISLWLAWVISNDATHRWPSAQALGAVAGVKADGTLAVALAGAALFCGWITAQVYWALYWLAPPRRPRWMALDYAAMVARISELEWTDDNIEAGVAMDIAIFLGPNWTAGATGWEAIRERITSIFDAYHSHGTAVVATALALVTMLMTGVAGQLSGEATAANLEVGWRSFLVILLIGVLLSGAFFLARDHAGAQLERYVVSFTRFLNTTWTESTPSS